MTAAAMRDAIRKHESFHPGKLVVTKVDESDTFGTAVSESMRAGLSLSLITDGVSIPENLHAASVEDLILMAIGREQAQVVCVREAIDGDTQLTRVEYRTRRSPRRDDRSSSFSIICRRFAGSPRAFMSVCRTILRWRI